MTQNYSIYTGIYGKTETKDGSKTNENILYLIKFSVSSYNLSYKPKCKKIT